jgi:hypothetical protein
MPYCTYCHYEVNLTADFARHLNTKKHLKNVETFTDLENKLKLCCTYCDKSFDTENDKLLHLDVCEKNIYCIETSALKNKITLLENKNKSLKIKNKKYFKKTIILQNDLTNVKNDLDVLKNDLNVLENDYNQLGNRNNKLNNLNKTLKNKLKNKFKNKILIKKIKIKN